MSERNARNANHNTEGKNHVKIASLHKATQKTVLITGAAGGIGRASVALFAEKGWRVIGVDRAHLARISLPMACSFRAKFPVPNRWKPFSNRCRLLPKPWMHW